MFVSELPLSGRRQAIYFGPLLIVGDLPGGCDPPLALKPVQGWIK
jgi:hypothetical protein